MLSYEVLKKVKVSELKENLEKSITALWVEIDKIELTREYDEVTKNYQIHKLVRKWFRNNGQV